MLKREDPGLSLESGVFARNGYRQLQPEEGMESLNDL
jgi:hypothetical protein